MKATTAVIVLSFLALPVSGSVGQVRIRIHGIGAESCGTWTKDRRNQVHVIQLSWVQGFVTGAASIGGVALKPTDEDGIEGWLDNYCTGHSLDTLYEATKELVAAMREK